MLTLRMAGFGVMVGAAALGCGRTPAPPAQEAGAPPGPSASWCDQLPRPANSALEPVDAGGDWFRVYRVADGVFAILEPLQVQEVISYLIVGAERALLFDTGLGLVPIGPVVERLTRLPVLVLNSHTHYDHVGGNAEFETVLALDTPFTRANQAGFAHADLAAEVSAAAFCRGPPAGADTAAFRTRPWRASRRVRDGERIDLGGREVEVLHVPGHTPDAVALLDRAAGLLWTGDTYYDATIWLFVPETDLDAYEASLARLTALPGVRRLLPAHNTASADPSGLARAAGAVARIRAGAVSPAADSAGQLVFEVDGIRILTARPVLEGRKGDASRGGSGLSAWP